MTMHPAVPAWARDFNNQRRHCWEGEDGTRWLDSRAPEYKHGWDADPQQPCTIEHDPKLAGNVEWLRFIRAGHGHAGKAWPFGGQQAKRGVRLLIEYDGHPTSEGRLAYAETYLRQHSNDWGLAVVARVFLDNEAGWSRIEIYDEALVGACELALADVEESYRTGVPGVTA